MAGCGRGAPWDTARVQWNGMPWNTLQSRASRARSQDFCAAVRRKNNGICLRYRRSPPCGLSKISRQHAAHNCPAPSRYPSRRSMGTVRRYGVSPPHKTHFSRAPAVCPDSARLRFRCAARQWIKPIAPTPPPAFLFRTRPQNRFIPWVFLCIARAYRTAAGPPPRRPAGDGAVPHMSLGTNPPGSFSRPRRYHIRRQVPVQRGMPLRRQFRGKRGQIVLTGQHRSPGTDRAPTVRSGPRGDRSLPGVSSPALPPDPLFRARQHLLRRQRPVFCGVPLRRQLRVQRGQIIEAGQYGAVGAEGTTVSIEGAAADLRLPFMALFAHPPNVPVTPRWHLVRRHAPVPDGVPLHQNRFQTVPPAIRPYRLLDRFCMLCHPFPHLPPRICLL